MFEFLLNKEFLGILAGIVVAISLSQKSIIRLKTINFFGSTLFAIYGVLINASSVYLVNAYIACTCLYSLYFIYRERENFKIVAVQDCGIFAEEFVSFHQSEITNFFPKFKIENLKNFQGFFVLRNGVPTCIFMGQKDEKGRFKIELDYVVPRFRDFKSAHYVFEDRKSFFKDQNCSSVIAESTTKMHSTYLKKLGFVFKEKLGETEYYERTI